VVTKPKVINDSPYYKILNYNIYNVLEKLMNAPSILIFIDLYHEEEIESFLRNNKFTIMNSIIQIEKKDNMMSYYPHIKTKAQLIREYQTVDWDFSCVVITRTADHLFIIRGIEEESQVGIRIKEMQLGLYDKLINIK